MRKLLFLFSLVLMLIPESHAQTTVIASNPGWRFSINANGPFTGIPVSVANCTNEANIDQQCGINYASPQLNTNFAGCPGMIPIWVNNNCNNPVTGSRFFRTTFNVDLDDPICGADVLIQGDNEYDFTLNGNHVGDGNNWQAADPYEVSSFLVDGQNEIIIEVNNFTAPSSLCRNYAFLAFCLTIDQYPSDVTTLFDISTTSDFQGNVTVTTQADPNPIGVNHMWDVYYAPNGSTSGNSQVPGNSAVFDFNATNSSATFSNNLVVNEWYYIKHGIWRSGSCPGWRETRKRFRVSVGFARKKPVVEIEDVPFTPTPEYLQKMEEYVQSIENGQEELSAQLQQSNLETSLKNYPNPFSQETFIEYQLDTDMPVTLYVSDISGKKIAVLADGEFQSAGVHKLTFDGSTYPAGLYFYTIKAGNQSITQKMVKY